MAVAAETKRKQWGNSNTRSVLPARPVEVSGVDRQSREGTPLTNPDRIYVLTFRAGDNTRDVLRNVALQNLGGSVRCKRWHRGGRCLSGCDSKGSHIPPTSAALATVTATLKLERAPG